ncbi:hypothetical protein CAPTEDRAFT_164003 [Capitella teleta]|uniref:Ragulator complex protein LAMTOR1 n=1 Tax=Capitella teleta TaxID=283909 RepID=R7V1T1_CAPTE|nr:hypothetical protein CAPTEDRAFT_164003 [Capitella teleta]|eukprot:ELU12803.1 hypothetical protein CAPTEDRAFT_164003 [Capitella teleta]
MGCCFSSDKDEDNRNSPQPDERTQLLSDPAREGSSIPDGRYEAPQEKGDEQSALNQILQQTARDVIDVAALESQTLEQNEYVDRARLYSNRLAVACANSPRHHGQPHLPVGVAAPQMALAAQPITLADIQLITSASQLCSKTVKEIKVRHKEDLVVPFGVP